MLKLTQFIAFRLNKAIPVAKQVIIALIIAILAFNVSIQEASAAWDIKSVMNALNRKGDIFNSFVVTGDSSVVAVNAPSDPKTLTVMVTGYSSTPDQTDDTPFITASNTRVRDGVVAANFLDFGTQVKIPALFGEKVFTVEDRMAKKNDGKMDIWFSERHSAIHFGIKEAEIVILD